MDTAHIDEVHLPLRMMRNAGMDPAGRLVCDHHVAVLAIPAQQVAWLLVNGHMAGRAVLFDYL